jgi:hypothetical protein
VDARREQLALLLKRRRRRLRWLLACAVTALVCGAVVGAVGPQFVAGGMPSAAAPGNAVKATVENTLSAKVTAKPLDLSQRVALDAREKRANILEWSHLTEPERRVLLDRYWRLSELTPAEQEKVFSRYAMLRDQPGERQEFLRIRAEKLKAFVRSLSPQDQAVLESMGDHDRAKRLLELWQARYGAW